jgi:hypothetical protein
MADYCVVTPYGFPVLGTKAEIIDRLCHPRFDNSMRLIFKFPGHQEVVAHSYSNEFSALEAASDAVHVLWAKLPEYGYRIYKAV